MEAAGGAKALVLLVSGEQSRSPRQFKDCM